MSTWTDPAWRAAFEAWIDDALAAAGERRVASFEQVHLRPWSTVLRVDTDAGIRYAKAGAASQRQEPALLALVATIDASLAPILVGAEDDRGWSITVDGGRRLRDVEDQAAVIDTLADVLPRYAELQQAASGRLPELLAAGVPDARSAAVADALAAGLGRPELFQGDFDESLSEAEIAELLDRLPQLAQLCGELESGPVAASIQHDDLHDANVFLDGAGRILDWGDAVIAHPFGTLLVLGIGLENRFELTADSAAMRRLRDAYLEAWQSYAPREALDQLADRAVQLDSASRALSWTRVLQSLPLDELAPWRHAAAAWMGELLAELRRLS